MAMIAPTIAAPTPEMTAAAPGWATQARRPRSNPRASRVGAAVAALICVTLAVYAALTQPTGGTAFGGDWGIAGLGGLFTVSALGLPGATFMAWQLAPRIVVANRSRVLGIAGVMTVGTIAISDALVSTWFAISILVQALAHPATGAPWVVAAGLAMVVFQALVGGIFVFVVGLLVVGVPVLGIVLPSALVWALVVRQLAGRTMPTHGG
jgi:hypothetical protein